MTRFSHLAIALSSLESMRASIQPVI
jgi:hypothetical protein